MDGVSVYRFATRMKIHVWNFDLNEGRERAIEKYGFALLVDHVDDINFNIILK